MKKIIIILLLLSGCYEYNDKMMVSPDEYYDVKVPLLLWEFHFPSYYCDDNKVMKYAGQGRYVATTDCDEHGLTCYSDSDGAGCK